MPTTPIQMDSKPLTGQPFTIRYDQTTVAHTKQFVVCASDEELVLECASGLIDRENGTHELPIHTRLALPWSAAERLHELLGQVLARQQAHSARGASGPYVADTNPAASRPAAGLPRFETPDA